MKRRLSARLWLSCMSLGLAFTFSVDAQDETASPKTSLSPAVEKALRNLSGRVEEREIEMARAETAVSPEPLTNDHIIFRDEFFKTIFVEKDGNWFTRFLADSGPVPYQLKGFELDGPHERPRKDNDDLYNIDRRVAYFLKAEAYRVYDTESGWGEWIPGKPALLTGVSMIRRNGLWTIASSPKVHFSVE